MNFREFYELIGQESTTELELQQNIKMTVEMYRIKWPLNKSEVKELYELKLEQLNTKIEDGIIIQNEFKDWFDEYYSNYKREKNDITFFERYKEYIKGYGRPVVQKIEEDMKEVINLAGDVTIDQPFSRKGMVIGDVQSGKTANYTGLINLGIDVGYNVIIVLAGLTNQLRSQTQARVEEGAPSDKIHQFLKKKNTYKQLEESYEDLNRPKYLSSINSDFNATSKEVLETYGTDINNGTHIIVTKKNTNTLENIYNWLKEDAPIKGSLLLIDDEADSASINTNKEDEDPTVINGKIRDILNLFEQNSYVGFTATPFANVFIDKDAMDEGRGSDIFPKDYIYILGESSNYIGVNALFSTGSPYSQSIVPMDVSDLDGFLPLKHKKEDIISYTLPKDVIDAINSFFISNTLLDRDKKLQNYRTMMVNMSRFNQIQEQLADVIEEYYRKVLNELKIGVEDKYTKALKDTYLRLYKDTDILFEDIKDDIYESNRDVEIKVVNQDSTQLDYSKTSRVIVIGGLSLARGLTLEGLIVSLYWRTTNTYDGLLQAGRWFGYRSNYIDYCRIFLTPEKIDDFAFIADATNELKIELKDNYDRNESPKDFAIKVRTGQSGLIVTAQNKMRNVIKKDRTVSYNFEVLETTTFDYKDLEAINNNHKLIETLVKNNKELIDNDFNPSSGKSIYGLKNINIDVIIDLISQYKAPKMSGLDKEDLVSWLRKNINNEQLNKWDIIFTNGKSNDEYKYSNVIQGSVSTRKMVQLDDELSILKVTKSRIGSPNDGRLGMTPHNFRQFNEDYKNNEKSLPQKAYLAKKYCHKPTILIYHLIPTDVDIELLEQPFIALAIEIPELDGGESKKQAYIYNE